MFYGRKFECYEHLEPNLWTFSGQTNTFCRRPLSGLLPFMLKRVRGAEFKIILTDNITSLSVLDFWLGLNFLEKYTPYTCSEMIWHEFDFHAAKKELAASSLYPKIWQFPKPTSFRVIGLIKYKNFIAGQYRG